MDVKKIILLLMLPFLFLGCDKKSGGGDLDPFVKADNPGCDGQAIPGEYLVVWKGGKVSLEHAASDEVFQKEFVGPHINEIVSSEPHYRIQFEEYEGLNQMGFKGPVNWGVDSIGASELWDKTTNTEPVIVAVIDSGVYIGHPELQAAIVQNAGEIENGIDDDGNGYIDDLNGYNFVDGSGQVKDYTGHGTHVSGVIAAQHSEGQINGVAPDVKIMPLAFIDSRGGGLVDNAISAIRYAADNGASVINASWGGNSCSKLLELEIKKVGKKGVLFVAASGNSGNDLSLFPEYPAAYQLENMITVGANTFDDKTAGFSNFGLLVDLVAPGTNIASTYPHEFDGDGVLDGVAVLNGTSMATPYVAGAAALLWSVKPDASIVDIKNALLDGARGGPFPVETRGSLYLPSALNRLNQ